MSKSLSRAGLALALISVAACGGGESQGDATASEASAASESSAATSEATPTALDADAVMIIEARQEGYKRLGKNFKAISDQIRGGSLDVAVVQESAAVVAETADQVGDWFPAGTSAASGVETDALDAIWSEPEKFGLAIEQFQAAASGLTTAAAGGDAGEIEAAFKMTGAACKNCHDTFRKDDD